MITLGIETSCDETALALLETEGLGLISRSRVIASLVHSQAELHSAYGGVFPSLAKREHGKNLVPLLHKLLTEAGDVMVQAEEVPTKRLSEGAEATENETRTQQTIPQDRAKLPTSFAEGALPLPAFNKIIEKFRAEVMPQNPELFESFAAAEFLKKIPAIDSIAVTEGPGLEPALWVGITFAKMLSELWGIPVKSVNHMEGHIVGSLLPSDITNGVWHKLHEAPMPAIALLISGGHTELVEVQKIGSYKIIGETIDDAVGEAFDKVARLLDLPYPGGPHLSLLAQKAADEGIEPPVKLPRPMIQSKDLKFSFSGLKTAVLYAVRKAPTDSAGKIDEVWKKGLALEFERAVTETLDKKLRQAIEQIDAKSIIVGGGVSANRMIREQLKETAEEYSLPLFLPSPMISGDNAVMIALAGAMHGEILGVRPLEAHGTKRLGVV